MAIVRRHLVVAIALLAAGSTSASAQGPRGGVPRMQLPEVLERERDQPAEPMFRAGVTRVEVSALVTDANGKPVRGLIASDFELLENGAPQIIRSFTPFSYEPGLIVLPHPVLAPADAASPPATVPASNVYTSSSRVFALILDDLHIDPRRTRVARAAAHRLIEQLAPSDLLFVITTSSSYSTGFFSRDRTRALKMIDDLTGQRLPDRTIGGRRFPGHDVEALRLDHYQRLCGTIRDASLALRDVSGRRKTVVLISEGSSYGAGMSDVQVRMPTASGNGRVNAASGSSRLMNDALAAAGGGNVAIYPLNPAGLGTEEADLIQGFGQVDGGMLQEILTEARQAKEMARDLAVLTGGVSLVDSNDPLAGIDRAVDDASHHYVLTYDPETPATGADYRRIEVKVRRPGLRVLARRGYSAPAGRPVPPLKVPGSLSPQLRALLSGVMPDDGLAMQVQAVPLSRQGRATTVAVIVEVNGAMLTSHGGGAAIAVEQGLLTVDQSGKASNGTRRNFGITLSPTQWEVLGASGLRSVWAVELSPGVHQLRVAALDTETGRGGSVYLEVEIPRDAPAPGTLIASRFLSLMPTPFVDKSLNRWVAETPTATRVFPEGDLLTVTVPHRAGAETAAARLTDAHGRVVWSGEGVPVDGLPDAARFLVPLQQVGSALCDLVIDSSYGTTRTTLGIVSPR
jgi:VWFA-related protein